MAKLNINVRIAMAVAVVAVVYATVPTFADGEGEPKELWDGCLTKMSPKCTLDIVEEVFWNGTVSDACCLELVQEGKVCHDTLIKFMADRPSFIGREAEYLKKKDDLWARCVLVPATA